MLEINIKTIPHRKQRYDTVGDYITCPNGVQNIFISDMRNWKYEFLVALHEMVESALCKNEGVREADIDRFDINFEKKRKSGDNREPGNDPKAPYFKQHQFATLIEMATAQHLGVNWEEYSKAVEEL